MSYNELIKNFNKVRIYMRDFYIYGFKSRNDYDIKSLRTYDNEKRRIESYIYNHIKFKRNKFGKNIFISIDSRIMPKNPLYKALKSKSFTNNDITLHFIIFDILYDHDDKYTINEISDIMHNRYLNMFNTPVIFDLSTIRNKLNEYIKLGILKFEKLGKHIFYKRTECMDISSLCDAIEFFSEISMCGVIGSFIIDKLNYNHNNFLFKHHYITQALDSEILYIILDAISQKKIIYFKSGIKNTKRFKEHSIIPLNVLVSSQDCRQYIIGFDNINKKIKSYRIDYIIKIRIGELAENFDELKAYVKKMQKNMWGVFSESKNLHHIEFTIYVNPDERYVYERLLREKRCGNVEKIDKNLYKFYADLYDINAIIPWIRTFICRITSINFSDKNVENRFKKDIEFMYETYNIK